MKNNVKNEKKFAVSYFFCILAVRKKASKKAADAEYIIKVKDMQAKKTEKADLEKRRGLYLEIGLVVVLVAALVAFNVKSYDNEKIEVTQRTAEDEI